MEENKKGFLDKGWVTVVALIVFAPIGVALLWYKKFLPTLPRIGVSIIALYAFFTMFGDSEEIQPEVAEEAEATTEIDINEEAVEEITEEAEETVEEIEEAIEEVEPEVEEVEEIDEEEVANEVEKLVKAGYVMEIIDIFERDVVLLDTFSYLTSQAGQNPLIMYDDHWIDEMVANLIGHQLLIDDFMSIEAEYVPEDYKEVHSIFSEVYGVHRQFVVDNMPSAVDNLDVDLLDEIFNHLSTANEKGDDAMAIIEGLDPIF